MSESIDNGLVESLAKVGLNSSSESERSTSDRAPKRSAYVPPHLRRKFHAFRAIIGKKTTDARTDVTKDVMIEATIDVTTDAMTATEMTEIGPTRRELGT
jgi:hypothetical protein